MPKTDTAGASKPAKAAATKAPARKAPARPRRAAAKTTAPTAAPADATTAGKPDSTITFRGRTMRVVMPGLEQLDVWNRTADRLHGLQQAISAARTDEEQAAADDALEQSGMKLVGRLSRIIHSVLVDEVDQDWIDEQFLARRLTYVDAAQVIPLALDALGVPHTETGRARPAARLRA